MCTCTCIASLMYVDEGAVLFGMQQLPQMAEIIDVRPYTACSCTAVCS